MLVFFFIIILLFAAYAIFSSGRNKAEIQGVKGEQAVHKIIAKAMRKERFGLFHDILIEHNGDITQIDHVLICRRGIFVIESKNLKGWIFGSERGRTWTHIHFKNKHKFQNPLHQNHKHLRILQEVLSVPRNKFISLVVFSKRSEFKTEVPSNVIYASNLKSKLYSYPDQLLENHQVNEIYHQLDSKRLENNRENRRRHRKHVKHIARNRR